MSNRIAQPPVEHEVRSRPPTARPAAAFLSSRRGAALVAGMGILLLAALAAFGNLVVVEGLVTKGDPARTARDIVASEGTFRLGVASLYAAAALDMLVAWALFQVFRPVHEALSRLAAWFRLAYAAVFLVAISQLHLLLLGYLTYTSRQMPRLLGVLLAIAGLGYAFDTMAAVLTSGPPIVVSTFTFVGEFLLAVWLLVRSRRLSQHATPFDTTATRAGTP